MKLLIVTQKVDKNDPVLGFFHRWIEEFAKWCEFVTVICLEKGEYNLPNNVKVLSLGKEEGRSKLKYIFRFYKYIWQERRNYNSVFVHMNQEYILWGWKLWVLLGKKRYLWRNHAKGNFLTTLAVLLSNKVFCTSPNSYTAKFKKTNLMPVGIDTEFFKPDPTVQKESNSFLFLGRIAPIKKVKEFVEWFDALDEKSHATIAGDALPKDKDYENRVRSLASNRIKFIGAVMQNRTRELYLSHATYVNMTPIGSYDKTIFEAAACGMRLIVGNQDLKFLEKKNAEELRNYVVGNHSLTKLMEKLKLIVNE